MKLLISMAIILMAALSAFAGDFDAGRVSGMAGNVLLSQPSASELLTCPVGIQEKGRLSLETGFQRKFELSDLDRVFAAAGYRYADLSISAGFSQFGRSNYYTEQLLRTSLSYTYSHFSLGVTGGARIIEIGDDENKVSLNAVSAGVSAGFNYDRYHLAAYAENINKPKLDENAPADEPVYNLFGEIEGPGQFSVMAHAAFEKYQKPCFSLAQYIDLQHNSALFWGISTNPLTYGGGLEVEYSSFRLMYAVSYHPVLGFTHNISLNFISGRFVR